MRVFFLIGVALAACPPEMLFGQEEKSRLHGYVGGPYKVLAADVAGDSRPELVLGYHQMGVVAVDQLGADGGLKLLARNHFGDEDRHLQQDDSRWSVPHVHNLAAGDVDMDGQLDLLLAIGGDDQVRQGRVVLVKNTGGGRFERVVEFSVPSQAKGVRMADLDGDGQLDLLYTARGSGYKGDITVGRLYIRRGLGKFQFAEPVMRPAGKSAYYVETADLDGDGNLDVAIPNEHDSCVTLFLNPGKGGIRERGDLQAHIVRVPPIPGRRSHAVNDVRAVDVNGDQRPDLVTANLGTSTVGVFAGNGDGTFALPQLLDAGKNSAFLASGDLDQDGDRDLVVTHWTEDFVSVFLNRGDGHFQARRDYPVGNGNYGVDVADMNGDGTLDIVTANYRARSVSLLPGEGDGSFHKARNWSRGLRCYGGKWMPYE